MTDCRVNYEAYWFTNHDTDSSSDLRGLAVSTFFAAHSFGEGVFYFFEAGLSRLRLAFGLYILVSFDRLGA